MFDCKRLLVISGVMFWAATSPLCAQIYPRGTITKLDFENGVITLNVGREATPRLESFSLANMNIKVTTNLKIDYPLKKVTSGMDVKLTLSPFDDVVAMMVMCPRIQYWIKGVNPDTRTLSVQHRSEEPKLESLRVHKDARIRIHSKEVKLDGLYPGLYTVMLLAPDKSEVYAITNEFWRTGSDPQGILISTNPTQRTITLFTGNSGEYHIRKFDVPADAKLIFRNEERPLDFTEFPVAHTIEELEHTTPVWVRLAEDQKTVISINANPQSFAGEVIAVDNDKDILTVKSPEQGELSIKLNAETKLYLNKRSVKTVEFQKGMFVEGRLSFSGTHALELRAAP